MAGGVASDHHPAHAVEPPIPVSLVDLLPTAAVAGGATGAAGPQTLYRYAEEHTKTSDVATAVVTRGS